ncbi:Uncharacterised protein [Pannonibacter phragmitetus]|uniref:Uncharacterized protein n=1 Tax=Pannonibacter phragmitetus TaxID=121719 RepID=A0A378ZV32_9HYPH|nr:hypothetical protein [Pannonibacter phragmitetus]SUB01112.1 Uncharacterised protein [Pannonibacter phragmitetus]
MGLRFKFIFLFAFAFSWDFGNASSIQIDGKHMLLTKRAECMLGSAYIEVQTAKPGQVNENEIEGCEFHNLPKEPHTIEIRIFFSFKERKNPEKKNKRYYASMIGNKF